MSTKDTNPKDAIGCKKPPLSTVPMPVMFEVGAALLEGACKYRRHNFRVVGVRSSIYFDATMRHLSQWWEGEDIDKDSGLNHVSKAIASLVVLRDAMMQGKVNDDRPPRANEEWMWEAQNQTDEVLKRHPEPKKPYTNKSPMDTLEWYAACLPQKAAPSDKDQALERMAKADLLASTDSIEVAARALNVGAKFIPVDEAKSAVFIVLQHDIATDTVIAVESEAPLDSPIVQWHFNGNRRVQMIIDEEQS
jgi:hypothetical protein